MVDRSVEVRLRADISQFQRQLNTASVETQTLTARMQRLDGVTDRYARTALEAAAALRAFRTQLRGVARDAERAAVALDRVDTNLGSVHSTLSQTSAGLTDTNNQLGQTNRLLRSNTSASNAFVRSNNNSSNSINQLTGRLGLAVDGVLTLGSALIPIGAVGGQAIGGLTVSVLALATAGASAVVAFQGIADATKAIDEYKLDPTVANLEKAQEAMAKLSPDAAAFVTEFQKLQPELNAVKAAAASGWFPGLTRSLDDWAIVAPKIATLFHEVGEAGGQISEDIAGSLASGRYDDFLRFLDREAPAAMMSLSRTTGDLTHGLSKMLIALDPGNDRFLGWLEDVGRGFNRWASSAEGRRDIQAFLEYARENGPEVKEFFLALVDATTQIVKAAAPLGGATLTALTKILEVVANIASSDLGTPFISALIALRLYARGMDAVAAAQRRFQASAFGGAVGGVAGGAAAAPAFIGPMTLQQSQMAAQAAAAQRAARLSAMAKGAGLALGVGLMSSGAADELGMTNTALLTLTGTMAGPYGAAAGAVVGTFLDIQANAGQTEAKLNAFNDVLASGTTRFKDFQAAAEAQNKTSSDYFSQFDGGVGEAAGFALSNPAESINLIGDALDGNIDRFGAYASAATGADETTQQLGRNLLQIAQKMGDTTPITAADLMAPDAQRIQGIIDNLVPSLERMGIGLDDIATMTPGQLRSFISDLTDMDGEILNSTNLLKGWTASLQAATGFLTRQGAMDAYQSMLNSVDDAIKENGRTLDKHTDKGLANREMLRGLASQGLAFADLMKDKGKRANFLDDLRADLRKTAEAFGGSKKWIDGFIDNLKFPEKKPLKVGMDTAPFDKGANRVTSRLDEIMGFKTTPRVGMDMAPFDAGKREVLSSSQMLDRLNPTPTVDLAASPFFQGAAGVRGEASRLDQLHPTVDITVTTTRINRVQEIIERHAAGLGGSGGGKGTGTGGVDDRSSSSAGGRYGGGGGFTQVHSVGGKASTIADPIDRVRQALESFRGAAEDSSDETKKDKDETKKHREETARHRKALAEARRDLEQAQRVLDRARTYSDSVGGGIATPTLTGGGLAGFDLGVEAGTNDRKAFLRALAKAAKKGLDGPLFDFLAQEGDLGLVQEFAGLNKRQIDRRERQYETLERTGRQLSAFAVEEKFGETVDELSDTVHDLAQAVKRMGHEVKKGAHDGTRDGTREGNRDRTRNTMTLARAGR